jgi:hypothetical protein
MEKEPILMEFLKGWSIFQAVRGIADGQKGVSRSCLK